MHGEKVEVEVVSSNIGRNPWQPCDLPICLLVKSFCDLSVLMNVTFLGYMYTTERFNPCDSM